MKTPSEWRYGTPDEKRLLARCLDIVLVFNNVRTEGIRI